MPRDYGQIQSAYWTHPDMHPLSQDARFLCTYLLSSPHTNGIGCFCAPVGYISEDLRMSTDVVLAAIAELEGAGDNGVVRRCKETRYVLIRGFLKWNTIDNANVGKARAKELANIPTKFSHWPELLEEIDRFGGEHLTVPQTLRQRVTQTVHQTGPNSEPNRTVPKGTEGNRSEPDQPPPHARARETNPLTAGADTDTTRSLPNGNGVDQPAPPSKGVPDHIRAEWEAKGFIRPKPPPAPPPAEQAVLLAELEGRYPTPPGDADGPPTEC